MLRQFSLAITVAALGSPSGHNKAAVFVMVFPHFHFVSLGKNTSQNPCLVEKRDRSLAHFVLSQLSPFIPLARSIHHSKTPLRSVLFGIHSTFGGLAKKKERKKKNKEDRQTDRTWTERVEVKCRVVYRFCFTKYSTPWAADRWATVFCFDQG